MAKYIVTEIVKYEVEADDEAAACDIITDAEDRDAYCVSVADRYAEEAHG